MLNLLWKRRRLASQSRRRNRSVRGVESLERRFVLAADPFPFVQSISQVGPASTNSNSVSWTIMFSEAVAGVDAGDFKLAVAGVTAATPLVVAGSGAQYTVTATNISGQGSIGLNLVDNGSIRDLANNPLVGQGDIASFASSSEFPTDSGPVAVTLSDVNADGKPDLISANQISNTLSVVTLCTSLICACIIKSLLSI